MRSKSGKAYWAVIVLTGCMSALAAAQEPASSDPTETRLRELQQQVDRVNDQLGHFIGRVRQMQQVIAEGSLGARSEVQLFAADELSSAFELVSIQCALDGKRVYSGDASAVGERPIFHIHLEPGPHALVVRMTVQGRGYGLFPYAEGYRIKLTSSHTFSAERGRRIDLTIVSFERDALTTPFAQRPAVRYDIRLQRIGPLRTVGQLD
ncbi:MAG: hypothetical protein JXR96_10440 [Deltaproteobacteria bacterium]|nr:hypothetical protein [Deltaproteobacteria bacterium]